MGYYQYSRSNRYTNLVPYPRNLMNIEVGPHIHKQVVLKYRLKLKAALAKHEVNSDASTHRILLATLIRIVEEHNDNYSRTN